MTETPTPSSDPERSRSAAPVRSPRRPALGSRPAFWPTAALVGASFLLLFEFLAFQLRHGDDPALGGTTQAAPTQPARPVLVRRIVKTRVVADAAAASGGTTASSGGGSGASSTAGSTPAATPAATPTPAPAPAPAAPVVSGSS